MATFQLLASIVGVLYLFQPSHQQGIALPPPIDEDLVAEGHIFLDPKSLERFRNEESNEADAEAAAKQDVEYLITEANTYYDTLRPNGLRIQIRLASIEILSQDLVSGGEITQGDVVEEKTILDNFGDFLESSARSGDKYDFALLFTGYDLSDPTAGYAELGSICNSYSRGVVELHGGFAAAGVFAHEVGHILGAKHDPDGALYIMSPKASNDDDDRIFQFSVLTADFILKKLREPLRDFGCLRQTSPSSRVPNVTPESYDGKMQDVEALCKRTTDPNSTPCTSSFFYNNQTSIAGDSMCFHVACRKPDNPKNCVTSIKTPEGTPCGLNKACKRGKCVSAPSAKTSQVNEKCIFGDDKNPNGVGMSCPLYVKDVGGQRCTDSQQFSSCCETCAKYETGWPDCPYGDVASIIWNGVKMSCSEIMADSGRNEGCLNLEDACCGTCHIPDNLKDSTCPYGDDNFVNLNSEKITCEQAFSKYGGKGSLCQNAYISKRCCGSCAVPSGGSAACPYGDATSINVNSETWTCSEAINEFGKSNLCANPNLAKACCKSCDAGSGTDDMDIAPKACQDDTAVVINGQRQTCTQAKDTFGLYSLCDSWGTEHCCETCKVPPGNPSNCRYGDRSGVSVNNQPQSCAQAAKTYSKAWLCSSSLKQTCCATCG